MNSKAGVFFRGFLWGGIVFVHFAFVLGMLYHFRYNCLPESAMAKLECATIGQTGGCAAVCSESDASIVELLAFAAAAAAFVLPLTFGFVWVTRSRQTSG